MYVPIIRRRIQKLEITNCELKLGGRRYRPYAFTEQGVAMLSSVLKSEQAINVNIAIMRAFVQLRRLSYNYSDLLKKVNAMERKYNQQFRVVFEEPVKSTDLTRKTGPSTGLFCPRITRIITD